MKACVLLCFVLACILYDIVYMQNTQREAREVE